MLLGILMGKMYAMKIKYFPTDSTCIFKLTFCLLLTEISILIDRTKLFFIFGGGRGSWMVGLSSFARFIETIERRK